MKYVAQSELWKLEQALKNRSAISPSGRSRILAKFRQIFPLTLFPDELIIEEKRVIWVQNKGPWTNNSLSIIATDIASVNSTTGPFFGHIHIKSLTGGPEIIIDKLLSHEITKIRSLVEGIALASRNGFDFENGSLEVEREYLLKSGSIN